MKKYILTLDQGTTSSRAIVFDVNGLIVAKSQKEYVLNHPKEGYVECNPLLLWDTQREVLFDVLKIIPAKDIAAMGITNQRETTILWDRDSGKPLYPAIIWQCRRTSKICDKLRDSGYEQYINEATGLVLDPYFSATKIKWIFDDNPSIKERAQKGKVCFGTVDTWLLWQLTKGQVHATDFTNASRTMLFNINTLKWDEKILGILDIPISILPKVLDTSDDFGKFQIDNTVIPIAAMVGDQQSALFGQTCFDVGDIKNTYGTGCFILCNTGSNKVVSNNRLLTTIGWKIGREIEYALEGSIFSAGNAIKWLRDEMRIIKKASECDELAEKISNNDGVYFVPAFTGLGAPHWDSNARGTITGITRSTQREHLARAVLESIGYQTEDVLYAMKKDANINFKSIYADGGASKSDFLMQFQSDISNIPVIRPENTESTALGAAFFAGLKVGFWNSKEELKRIHTINREFMPQMTKTDRNLLKRKWNIALKCSKGFSSKSKESEI